MREIQESLQEITSLAWGGATKVSNDQARLKNEEWPTVLEKSQKLHFINWKIS
jgi:hypothetical protein